MRPSREPAQTRDQTYFVSFQTAGRLPFFRNERWAIMLLNTLQRYTDSYALHDFVILHDHVHLLLSPDCPLEKAVQLIKGGYSFQARREFAWKGELWQPGFTDHRVRDFSDFEAHLGYIGKNVRSLGVDEYRFCGMGRGVPLAAAPPWLKPQD
jgi:putative transposase